MVTITLYFSELNRWYCIVGWLLSVPLPRLSYAIDGTAGGKDCKRGASGLARHCLSLSVPRLDSGREV